jgi:fibronectin type 3 domain-containing protein
MKWAIVALIVIVASGAAGYFFMRTAESQQAAQRQPGKIHRITVSWDKVPKAVGYKVYRRPYRSADFSEVGKTQQPSFEDPAAIGGERYCYQVASLDAKGKEGARSKEFCVTVPYP